MCWKEWEGKVLRLGGGCEAGRHEIWRCSYMLTIEGYITPVAVRLVRIFRPIEEFSNSWTELVS